MSIDIEEMKRAMESFKESPEGQKFLYVMGLKHQLKLSRYKRLENWLLSNDFESLMYRLILEHGDDYREKCHHNGYEVYPNNKLGFLIDYVVHNTEPLIVPKLNCRFNNQVWLFKGYYFQMVWGQGVLTNIFNAEDMRLVLQV